MTDPCSQPGLIPLGSALELLLAGIECRLPREPCALLQAHGRVLARECCAPVDVPPTDNSAMDGYALRHADLIPNQPTPLPVSQRIPAGTAPPPLTPGTAARIFTGAPIPAGADTVVMQERTLLENNQVLIAPDTAAGSNIRPRGQDIRRGTVVMPAGTRLNATAIGVLASIGRAEVEVYRRLRVAVLSTGDELADPGVALKPGQIYNSNRYLVLCLLRQLGLETLDLGPVADSRASTRNALSQAAEHVDIILTTGGVSVGEEDHVKTAIQDLGQLDLWRINLKPGKPFAAGKIGRTPLFGLPGNPGAALVTFALLVRPCLCKAQGLHTTDQRPWVLQAAFAREHTNTREEYLRARRGLDGTVSLVEPQGSGTLSSLLQCDGLIRIPPRQPVREGEPVEFYPLHELLDG
ncbi:molybdopterin molybdotransferase MoeA [Marinobacterium weihaiense]|uniref:Molybdopterin molybdenumtransferase n=1 Tax=Marinobacterium weihaiense TaxID=2851016 RepID=A0ABS6ME12_9GAMM|nr:gephyrin-like molybdotransferase Glp [Marinobacterium weihaiense]MBV0934518.1 molybdopterin molybdotransferase MoeA [Marinobacterium weihaiense]